MKAAKAAAYLNISRSKFYKVLEEDPELKDSSFTLGKCRLWPVAALDAWIQARGQPASADPPAPPAAASPALQLSIERSDAIP
jgi:predicted DNA-binding transcriptional regulator AlpA